jgi:hypothetical protein
MEKIRALFDDVLGPSKRASVEHAVTAAGDFPVRPLMAMLAARRS